MQQPLEAWRNQIEAITGGRVITVPVTTDREQNLIRIPPAFPGRAVVRNLLLQPHFVAQFVRAHALNVNYSGAEGTFHFVLLNLALSADWKDNESGLLGHEYGHIWLNALGYRSPLYDNGLDGCVLTHAGDIVQHILIREETKRRGFNYLGFWAANIERWITQSEQSAQPPTPNGCERAQMVSMFVDTVLSFQESGWPHMDRFQASVRKVVPDLDRHAETLQRLLSGADIWDRSVYEYSLIKTIEVLRLVHTNETV